MKKASKLENKLWILKSRIQKHIDYFCDDHPLFNKLYFRIYIEHFVKDWAPGDYEDLQRYYAAYPLKSNR